jgi:hypothetical protein
MGESGGAPGPPAVLGAVMLPLPFAGDPGSIIGCWLLDQSLLVTSASLVGAIEAGFEQLVGGILGESDPVSALMQQEVELIISSIQMIYVAI